jgi:collagen triple helix repeat protein
MSSPVRRRGLTPATAILAAVSALALLMSVAAPMSAQTSPDPIMYACYVPLTGTVYRIKSPGAPDECTQPKGKNNGMGHQDHVQFAFNERGNVGPVGPMGPMGPAGPLGPVGPMGPAGPQGEIGPMGLMGPQGAVGPVGPMGPQGAIGPMGPQGPQGVTGAVGPQGDVGPMGPQGDLGPMGPQGAQGIQGLKGDVGAVGPQGERGLTGPEGAQGRQGVQGIPGVSAYEVINRNVSIAPGVTQLWVTNCSPGKKPLGGGYSSNDTNGQNMLVSKNGPFSGGSNLGWVVEMKNPSASTSNFNLYAVCAVVL